MSSDFDETINQFHVGDSVKEKGKNKIMIIISNAPGGGLTIQHYLKTDTFTCQWIEENGQTKTAQFKGSDLESA